MHTKSLLDSESRPAEDKVMSTSNDPHHEDPVRPQATLSSLERSVGALGSELHVLSADLSALKDRVTALELQVKEVNSKVDDLSRKADLITKDIEQIKSNISELTAIIKLFSAHYATKEELAHLAAKIDIIPFKLQALELTFKLELEQALKAHTEFMFKIFATKEDLSNAVHQLTWRMAILNGALLVAAAIAARVV